jgi:hypothetical protein
MYDALPTPASLQVVTSTVIARILLSFFRAPPLYSVLPSQTSLALDWLKAVDRLDPGQGGHIPLCAAVHSSLGLASHPTLVLLALLAGPACFGRLRIGQNPASLQKGTTPLASIGLSLLLHTSYCGINGTCLVGVKLLVVRKPNVPRDCLGGLCRQTHRMCLFTGLSHTDILCHDCVE